jgi:NAD(P)-dependent dehydrogenase (short-subunit alcohol dehydrogenase family)
MSTSPFSGAVVIGGVGEGLGFALAARFARAGHPVVMLARSQDKLDRFADTIRSEGGIATGLATDVRDENKIIVAFEHAVGQYGVLSAAIFNAGANHRKPVLEISGDVFEKVWRLACFGAFVFGREAARHMVPRCRHDSVYRGDGIAAGWFAIRCVRRGKIWRAGHRAKHGA